MTNETRQQITDALAKATPCPKCGGDQFLVTGGSHAEHDPSCDGSCLNCPVEVPDQDVGPCDCVMQQANVTEADYQRVVGWLRALLADLDAADAQNQRNLGLLEVIERLGVERDALRVDLADAHETVRRGVALWEEERRLRRDLERDVADSEAHRKEAELRTQVTA